MKREWLEDYEYSEMYVSAKLSVKAERELKKHIVLIRSLYPELGLKENDLYANRIITYKHDPVPVWAQLPYYENLIVAIWPVKDIDTFKQVFGLTPESLAELAKKTKRIKFILSWTPREFENLDYLDPIVQLKPPVTSIREWGFYTATIGENQFDQLYARSTHLATQMYLRLKFYREQFSSSIRITPSKHLKGTISSLGLNLAAFGYSDIIASLSKFIDENPDRGDEAYTALFLYGMFLCGPYVDALNGVYAASDEYSRDLDILGIVSPTEVFHADVGKLLTEKLLLAPTKGAGETLDVCPHYAKARTALEKLNNFVSAWEWYKKITGESLEILSSRKAVLEATWNETTRSLKSWPKDVGRAKTMIEEGIVLGSISIGVLGSLALGWPSGPGILATILSKYVGDFLKRKAKRVTPILSEKLVRFCKPSHTIAIMNIIREWHPAHKAFFETQRNE